MEKIELRPIATVSNDRNHLGDDNWGEVISQIRLQDDLSDELFIGLETFSHVEVIFVFHRNPPDKKVANIRHPRNNSKWPKLGLLAQRSVHHPNPLGLSIAKILNVNGSVLTVQGLDAVNGSPILDIKPVFQEFLPLNSKQPAWVSKLLQHYWDKDDKR